MAVERPHSPVHGLKPEQSEEGGTNERRHRHLRIIAVAMLPGAATAQSGAANDFTFTRDVAPILYDSCVVCHRAGEMAPMALTTYAEVRPWARSIRNRVVAREMPPWHIDKNIGIQDFKEDISLKDDKSPR